MTSRNLNAARVVGLTLQRSAQPDGTSRLANAMTLLLAEARAVVRVLSAWRARSAHRRALAALDDHLLQDIGLTRADVERELAKTLWRLQPIYRWI